MPLSRDLDLLDPAPRARRRRGRLSPRSATLADPYPASGKRVITADDVESLPKGMPFLVPEGAILTPLALDLLRKRGQELATVRGAPARPLAPIVVANWKSNKTTEEARAFADKLAKIAPRGRAIAVVCPPF